MKRYERGFPCFDFSPEPPTERKTTSDATHVAFTALASTTKIIRVSASVACKFAIDGEAGATSPIFPAGTEYFRVQGGETPSVERIGSTDASMSITQFLDE